MKRPRVTFEFYCFDRDCRTPTFKATGATTTECLRKATEIGWRNIGADAWLCPRCAAAPTAEQSRDEMLPLLSQALEIIADAIAHGMPVTPKVAEVRNGIRRVLSTRGEG